LFAGFSSIGKYECPRIDSWGRDDLLMKKTPFVSFLFIIFGLCAKESDTQIKRVRPILIEADYTRFEMDPPFSTGYVVFRDPADRSISSIPQGPTARKFSGFQLRYEHPLDTDGTFASYRSFIAKRAAPRIDRPLHPSREAIANHFDLTRNYPIDKITLTKYQNSFLFNLGILDAFIGNSYSTERFGFLIEPLFGMRAAQISQLYDKTMNFLYLEGPPVEEIRNYSSYLEYCVFGPQMGFRMDITPFSTIPLFDSIKIFSQVQGAFLYGNLEIWNHYYVLNGSKKIPIIEQKNQIKSRIPNIEYVIGLKIHPDLYYCKIALNVSRYTQVWIKADKSFMGTYDYTGGDNVSITGYSLGASIDF
jgi:hypothetical protein